MRALYPVITALLALAGGSLLAADEPAPLRLVGMADGREFTDIESRKGVLVSVSGDVATPVPPGTRWRLEGELTGHESEVFFAPSFLILTRAAHPISAEQRTRTFGLVRLLEQWPWEESGNYIRAVLVVMWLVDGKVTRVVPIAANTEDGPSDFVKGLAAFELTADECRGRPVVMLWKDGKWRQARRWFTEPQVDAIFARLHWEADLDVAGALSGVKADALWTRFRDEPFLYMIASGGFESAVPDVLAFQHAGTRATGGSTPLHVAAANGYRGVAAALLAGGAKQRPLDNDRHSPFDAAILDGHVELACDLLAAKPHPDDLRRAFQLALSFGDAATVRRVLAAGGERIVKKLHPDDFSGILEVGDTELVQRLVQLGMPLKDERPLLHAVVGGNATVVQLLLDAGAHVGRAAPEGTSPIILAAARGNVAVLETLHRAGADLNAANKFGESPLGLARRAGHAAAIEFLVRHGATVDSVAQRTPDRDPKTRWITDRLRPESGPVYGEDEVSLPPVVKTVPRIEVIREPRTSFSGGTVTRVGTDPYTGQIFQYTVRQMEPIYTPGTGGSVSAVASMIVETDGSVSHAIVVQTSSEEIRWALDKVVGDYTFEPGELDGRKVRTRITLPILVPN